ncbi:MAG: hypothetical protein QGM46_06855 [Actinomycetota bacterium]|nr:hypothetical protein [Actinomycetota bacterium]MDK1017023.1 hypothetical protein [Actinomycetota bacterium]MDK1026811.1 hypothetical protein [Actinomycetota bacterium]MDK1039119.1 hypothetical protein [Actinomycetota bacterium]MDK1097126.1 hypothetical protein [Actinomycetota bacterium]
MEYANEWNWVLLAYGVTYFALVVYASSIALRISRARKRLGGPS